METRSLKMLSDTLAVLLLTKHQTAALTRGARRKRDNYVI